MNRTTRPSQRLAVPEPALSKREIFQGIRRFVTFLLLAALFITVFTHTGGVGANVFQYHPLMVSCAYLAALPEVMSSVAQMKKGRAGLPREEVIVRHQIATVIFNMCILCGIAAVEYTKFSNGYPHLISSHGLVGSVCGSTILAQMITGNLLRYVLPRNSSLRPLFKTAHGIFSMAICLTGLLCLIGGLMATETAKSMVPSAALRGVLSFSAPLFIMWGYMH